MDQFLHLVTGLVMFFYGKVPVAHAADSYARSKRQGYIELGISIAEGIARTRLNVTADCFRYLST